MTVGGFKAARSWASGSTDESMPRVTKNVLAGFVVLGETNPRRPVVRDDAAGGWKDLTTLLTCYQQPDSATMRARDMERAPPRPELSHELSHRDRKSNGATPENRSSAAS